MRKPSRQQPRSTSMPNSLSRILPKLRLPGAPATKPSRPPTVGKPQTKVPPKK